VDHKILQVPLLKKLNSLKFSSPVDMYKRPLGKPRRRWEDNIKMDPQEVGCGGMD